MSVDIPFGARRIGADHPVVVIAEIGINHEGSVEACGKMIIAAAGAGADAIKLQTVDPDESYAPGTASYALFSRTRLSREATARMFDLARELGMETFTTTGDAATLDWVDRLHPAAHKISSGLLTHLPLIRRAAATGRSVIMSTGMSTLEDVDDAVMAAQGAPVALMQCTSLYPAPPDSLDLRVISTLGRRYDVPVGFSDHSLGIDAASLAVAAGATTIEKHFTLDPSRSDFDHHLSLDPKAFERMVRAIRNATAALGRAEKRLSPAQVETALRARRSLVVRRDVNAGATLAPDLVAVLRTAPDRRGLAPKWLNRVVGRRTRRNLKAFDPITAEALEGEL